MQRIYRATQKIEVKIDDISVFVSPLTLIQKQEIQGYLVKAGEGDTEASMKLVVTAMKYALKDVRGLVDVDDDGKEFPYQLQFVDGILADSCIDDLLNIPCSAKITMLCSTLMAGVPDKILDPTTGLPVEGIIICSNKAKVPPRKK